MKALNLALVLREDRRGSVFSRFLHSKVPQLLMLDNKERLHGRTERGNVNGNA